MKRTSGVYCIENLITGILYIGAAINLTSRKNEHFRKLRDNNHENIHLQRSYNKHGVDVFKFYVLEYILKPNKNTLKMREQSWIDLYKGWGWHLVYNISENATSPMLGRKHKKETVEQMSKDRKGERNAFYNKNHSEESRRQMSKSKSGENNYLYRKYGAEHNRSKPIEQIDKDTGFVINLWGSARDAERHLGISHGSISRVCRNKQKLAGGYVWRFV